DHEAAAVGQPGQVGGGGAQGRAQRAGAPAVGLHQLQMVELAAGEVFVHSDPAAVGGPRRSVGKERVVVPASAVVAAGLGVAQNAGLGTVGARQHEHAADQGGRNKGDGLAVGREPSAGAHALGDSTHLA